MCASCGCGKPNDQHGDSRHITMDQIQQAAKAANISPREVAQNIMTATGSMSGAPMGNQQSSGASTSSST